MAKNKGLKWCLFFILLVSLCLISFNGVMAAERTEIRVGAPASITGLNAMTGKEHRWGYEQSVKDINAKGTTILHATHNRDLFRGTAYRVFRLDRGNLFQEAGL